MLVQLCCVSHSHMNNFTPGSSAVTAGCCWLQCSHRTWAVGSGLPIHLPCQIFTHAYKFKFKPVALYLATHFANLYAPVGPSCVLLCRAAELNCTALLPNVNLGFNIQGVYCTLFQPRGVIDEHSSAYGHHSQPQAPPECVS